MDEVKIRYGLAGHAAWQAVLYAKSRGQIGAVKKGLYYVVPSGADPASYLPDLFLVAAKATPSGLAAYHAALDLHGVAYSSFHEVAMAVEEWRRGFGVGDARVRFVVAPVSFGSQTVTREGVEIRVTDRERTLVDGCDRPGYVGGLEEFLRSVASFPSVDHARALDYVRRYERKSLAAKTGWLFSRFAQRWGFPDDVHEELQALRPRGAVVFERAAHKRLDRKWGVLLPRTLEERLGEA
ncbi:MAG: hypothetical protein HY775_00695 [Acidobacteria bacterium]|nr:hypothetical protein [Acidobacteriota bacterium]